MPQPDTGRDFLDVQRLPEKRLVTKALDRFKVALAYTQQAEVAFDNVGGLQAFGGRIPAIQTVDPGRLRTLPHQRQARVGS